MSARHMNHTIIGLGCLVFGRFLPSWRTPHNGMFSTYFYFKVVLQYVLYKTVAIHRTEKDGATRRILGRSTKLMKTNFRDRGKFVTKCKVYHHETGCLTSALLEGALTKVGFTRHFL